jgi:hypothetical protein
VTAKAVAVSTVTDINGPVVYICPPQEAARYLETFKAYETKPASGIQVCVEGGGRGGPAAGSGHHLWVQQILITHDVAVIAHHSLLSSCYNKQLAVL